MESVEQYAMNSNRKAVGLETRIELEENHAAFSKLGFVKVPEGVHEGYCKPTFIVMRKQLFS